MILKGSSDFIGFGTYGRVYKARLDNEDVVIKICYPIPELIELQCPIEPCILRCFDHPNIVGSELAFIDKDQNIVTAQVKCERSLHDCGQLEPDLICRYMIDILQGLVALKQRSIIHADINPANILLLDGRAKLCDFGLSILMIKDLEAIYPIVCNFMYRAPEIFHEKTYDTAVDIWSLGCVLVGLITGRRLFAHMDDVGPLSNWASDNNQELKTITSFPNKGETYRSDFLNMPKKYDVLVNLAKSMLNIDPTKRPSALEILQSEVLGEYIPVKYNMLYVEGLSVQKTEMISARRIMAVKLNIDKVPPELDHIYRCFRMVADLERSATFASLTLILISKLKVIRGKYSIADATEYKKAISDLSFLIIPPN